MLALDLISLNVMESIPFSCINLVRASRIASLGRAIRISVH